LNRLEATLPDEVRITSLRPTVARDGTITVTMTVAAQSVDDIEQFMENLEGTAAFSEVYPLDDEPSDDGGVRASLEGKYAPAP
jgi:Tfp pilus assembly protein PilN